MHGDWSREIRREFAGTDARFELPVRPLGWGRLIGLFLIGFGLLFVWSPAQAVWQTLQEWMQEEAGSAESLFGLFTLLFVIAGSVPAFGWPVMSECLHIVVGGVSAACRRGLYRHVRAPGKYVAKGCGSS